MEEKRFSIGDAVSFGWDTMKKNVLFLVIAMLIFWLVEAIVSSPQAAMGYVNSWGAAIIGLIFGILSLVVGIFIMIAQAKIGLRYCDEQEADFPDLYEGYPNFLNVLIGAILYGLIVLAGLILLIIPGIYWAIKYHFFPYLIIDRNMTPLESLKKSGELTKDVKWHLIVFWLAVFGINLIGAILCGVGLLFSVPVTLIATAYVYRTLLSQTPGAQVTDMPVRVPPVPPKTTDKPPAAEA